MNYCANCGHELGVGRFCTNCGVPVPGRHPAAGQADAHADAPTVVAQRPVDPVTPPTGSPPPPPRYPLFADTDPEAPTRINPRVTPPPASSPAPPDDAPRRRRGALLPFLALLLALVVAGAAYGAYQLTTGGGDEAAHDPGTTAPGSSAPGSPSTGRTPHRHRSGRGEDLADHVSRLAVPGTAPAGVDLRGNPVSFGKENLLDGDDSTAWRVAGDASGGTITIRFDSPVTLTSVGLINGYAKLYRGYNGYWLNRKVISVRWTFDDGTSVTQHLKRRTITMQSIPVDAGPTSTLSLEILSTIPSNKALARDYTAISELSLTGSAR